MQNRMNLCQHLISSCQMILDNLISPCHILYNVGRKFISVFSVAFSNHIIPLQMACNSQTNAFAMYMAISLSHSLNFFTLSCVLFEFQNTIILDIRAMSRAINNLIIFNIRRNVLTINLSMTFSSRILISLSICSQFLSEEGLCPLL